MRYAAAVIALGIIQLWAVTPANADCSVPYTVDWAQGDLTAQFQAAFKKAKTAATQASQGTTQTLTVGFIKTANTNAVDAAAGAVFHAYVTCLQGSNLSSDAQKRLQFLSDAYDNLDPQLFSSSSYVAPNYLRTTDFSNAIKAADANAPQTGSILG